MNSESYEYWVIVNGCVDHECHVNVDDEGNHVRVREQLETICMLESRLAPLDTFRLYELHHSHGVWANSHSDELYVDAYEGFRGECECAQYAQDHTPIAEWVGA
jgi:hypothetical protein